MRLFTNNGEVDPTMAVQGYKIWRECGGSEEVKIGARCVVRALAPSDIYEGSTRLH